MNGRALHGIVLVATTVMLMTGCEMSATTYRPVVLTADQKAAYWAEVQRRVPAWFQEQGKPVPALPDANAVYSKVLITEFTATPGTTCYFDPPARVEIGDDKWASGCVEHELGHALLYIIGDPCWSEFEHPGKSC